MQRRLDNGKGIFLLWVNWVWSLGLLILLIVVSLWVRPLYMPFVAYGLQFVMFLLIKHNREKQLPVCYLFPFLVSRILFWSGTVMLFINLLYSRWLVGYVFDYSNINPNIPFIVTLIVAPISTLMSAWLYGHRKNLAFCRDCHKRAGTPVERGFLGVIFTREGNYQVKLFLYLVTVVTVVSWCYYLMTYVNSSISQPDKFVFFWSEVMIWFASSLYFGMRYIGIWGYYCQNIEGSAQRHGRSTQIRFLIIENNRICIHHLDMTADSPVPGANYYDTPESTFIPLRERVTDYDAHRIFENHTGISNADIRFMYSTLSGNADCNIFHYFVFMTPEERDYYMKENSDCRWVTFHEIAKMLNNHELNPLLSAELVRLYTIAMAWKTYDRNGMRRYKIKHYRPTFHLEDIKNWDVDFNDPAWLYVADNNQDVHFYRLRRFWRKYVNGIGSFMDDLDANKKHSTDKK